MLNGRHQLIGKVGLGVCVCPHVLYRSLVLMRVTSGLSSGLKSS